MDATHYHQTLGGRKRIVFRFVASFLVVFILAIFYFGYVVYRSATFYSYVKHSQRGWSGKVHQADAELGLAPIPNAQGAEVLPIGSPVAMRYDEDGFRIPVTANSTSAKLRPLILSLGCSFTYGAATRAEDTYPFLVGQSLGGTTKNAGVSGYGLAQMLILARRLVPRYKPDYVIVQYSPWLTTRAVSGFAPTYYGRIPTPFFYEREGELALHPPVFRALVMDSPIDEYRNSSENMVDLASFVWRVGLPLFLHDDFSLGASLPVFFYTDPSMTYYRMRKFLGLSSENTRATKIEKYVYGEISRIVSGNGGKILIVILDKGAEPTAIPQHVFPAESVVNAQDALVRHLSVVSEESYGQAYWHWRANPPGPPETVDEHPNEVAHRIIAEEILLKIKSMTDRSAKLGGTRESR